MPDHIYIGNWAKGLRLDRLPFNIDNDAFPTLFNAYSWRGRIKRKRGTKLLGQLERTIIMVASFLYNWQSNSNQLIGGAGNLITSTYVAVTKGTTTTLTTYGQVFLIGQQVAISGDTGITQLNGGPYTIINIASRSIVLNLNSSTFTGSTSGGIVSFYYENPTIVPGTISLTFAVLSQTYTDTTENGVLTGSGGGTGTINYATGAITITGGGADSYTGTFDYYPTLPVLGLEDVDFENTEFPELQAFDTTYSYQVNQTAVPYFYETNYYKNSNNPVFWSNGDYAQFWSANYQSAFWVTNNKPGLHLVNVTYTSGSGTSAITFNIKYPSYYFSGNNFTTLVVGDVLWFNEWTGSTINGISGVVTSDSGYASGNYVVTFTSNQTVTGSGIAQLLTNSIPGQDGIRWYDGDPTSGTGLPTQTPFTTFPLTSNVGWVNFAPPLTATSVSINDQASDLWYLAGALAIVPFKDRLLFFAPYIMNSSGTTIQTGIEDTVIWSWNGTPYYTVSDTSNTACLVPSTETANINAYYVDQSGKGGWISAGLEQPITTVTNNEDVLLVGFGGTGKKTRFVYTGNDFLPFLFYLINSELPSTCTFSGITVDRGGIEIGTYGITLTTQQSCQRIDLEIPDTIFQIQNLNNGNQRVNAIRDFYREWIYFSYPTGDGAGTNGSWVFPSNSLIFNYRDNTWGMLRENYTHHGSFRAGSQYTWQTLPFSTWATWVEPWNAGTSQALYPDVVAGTPQGYVVIKDQGLFESVSASITAITDDGFGFTQITSPNHCVNAGDTGSDGYGDYLYFQNAIEQTYLNGQIGLVTRTIDEDNFVIDIAYQSGTYLGLGQFSRLSQPFIQTKQFPFYWEAGRQTRLGVQKYLFDRTASGEVTINIYLSQDPDTIWNSGPIVPSVDVINSGLEYSQLLYTCPEGTNIGLSAFNINLQSVTSANQYQIWHRINTSLQGDSVQIGITLDDTQMRDITIATSEISLHGIQLTAEKGPLLA